MEIKQPQFELRLNNPISTFRKEKILIADCVACTYTTEAGT